MERGGNGRKRNSYPLNAGKQHCRPRPLWDTSTQRNLLPCSYRCRRRPNPRRGRVEQGSDTAAHASCPLTPTQARYPQIDRQALLIYLPVKRFHLFVYGKEFKVIADHKPLMFLFNNPSIKPSARIDRTLVPPA